MNARQLQSLVTLAGASSSLRELFVSEPQRAQRFTFDACGLHADFSRQLMNSALFDELILLTRELKIPQKFRDMMDGHVLNVTEGRAVLHTALRDPLAQNAEAVGSRDALTRALELAEKIRNNPEIDAVINIGIGGSDLGPAMATRALRAFHDGPLTRFVSNIDPADFDEAIYGLDPARTMVVVSSKTFTTLETMHNAERAKQWMAAQVPDWQSHFVASTAYPEVAQSWGIPESQCLIFGEWVGGRFSLSSTIGFPLMCAIGAKNFSDFLSGMYQMDQHALETSPEQSLPVVHALVWWANAVLHRYATVAVVPYSHDLARLPAYLQQLVMESNGKSVREDGVPAEHTSPVVWGEPGTNGQHAFFQMLHQGTQVVPVEFISSIAPMGSDPQAHDLLIANMIAQSEALAGGSLHEDPHRNFPGNRPSTVIFMDALSPYNLGALLAMYEHSTAVQGWLMGVNSFDQFGVELGKKLATDTAHAIASGEVAQAPLMTRAITDWYVRQSRAN